MTAAFATADVFVPEHDSGPAERTVKDLLEFHILAHHLAVRFGEDELRGRRIDCPAQKRNELVGDWDALFVRALRLAPGTHTVELAYEKDESVDDGLECAILNFELARAVRLSRLTVSTGAQVGSSPEGWEPPAVDGGPQSNWVIGPAVSPRIYTVPMNLPVDPRWTAIKTRSIASLPRSPSSTRTTLPVNPAKYMSCYRKRARRCS